MIVLTSIAYCVFLLAARFGSFPYVLMASLFNIALLVLIAMTVGKSLFFVSLPAILAISSFLLLPFLSPDSWVYGFIVLDVSIFTLSLYLRKNILDKENPQDRRSHPIFRKKAALDKTLAITVLIISYTGLFAIVLFPMEENEYVSFWMILLGFFAASSIIFWEILKLSEKRSERTLIAASAKKIEKIPAEMDKIIILASLSLGLIALEAAWALSFWPLGFFSSGIALVGIMFAFLDIFEQILFRNISFLRIIYDIGIAISAILMVAMTTKWIPI